MAERKSVSMQDLADKLGISKVTVSKALNGKDGVGEELKEKIFALARESGYVLPDYGKRKSKKVGIIMSPRFSSGDEGKFYNGRSVKTDMYYAEDVIEEVRSRNDIVSVISEYVKLQRKGSSYFGLCPFHNEKSPSFSVSPDKQMYYCFGCGAGGNVFTFIQEYENYSFPEAMKFLAERAGITLPEKEYSQVSLSCTCPSAEILSRSDIPFSVI